MKTKIFEIRDRATYFAVLATKLESDFVYEKAQLRYNGFGTGLVMMTRLTDGKGQYAPYKWDDRTMTTAHMYITTHFDMLETGYVVDVEYINGETDKPKKSDVYE